MERLERLVYLAESWNGPMSAAVAITNLATELPLLVNTWLNTSALRNNVDIHLIFDDNVIIIIIIIPFYHLITYLSNLKYQIIKERVKLFPINYLRNIAAKNARTDYVMYIEGDYVVPKNFKNDLTKRLYNF